MACNPPLARLFWNLKYKHAGSSAYIYTRFTEKGAVLDGIGLIVAEQHVYWGGFFYGRIIKSGENIRKIICQGTDVFYIINYKKLLQKLRKDQIENTCMHKYITIPIP